MSKRQNSSLADFIALSAILIYFTGVNNYLNLLFTTFKSINAVLLQLENASILSFIFKYSITFPIVGLILSYIGSPRGKEGYVIGKVLYFLVGYIVCLGLDNIANLLF